MTPFARHLLAASGYLELGLPSDAEAELEGVEPEMQTHYEVLSLRVDIYRKTARWELMRQVAEQLCERRPDQPGHPANLAYATRRCRSLQDALPILIQAAMRFPQEPLILYNLACYQAQLGYLNEARGRLREAIRLAPKYRTLFLKDNDLIPLHGQL